MNALLKSIYAKLSGSALTADVGGRVYLDQAEQGADYPYIVFFIVSGTPERTFTEHYTDTALQFSMFSTSRGAAEITDMYADLKALFDECSLTIPPTGPVTYNLVWIRELDLTTMVEDHTTPAGTVTVKHWASTFEIKTSLI